MNDREACRARYVAALALAVGAASAAFANEAPLVSGPSFFADRRAHTTGDLLTVLVTENSSATESARTQTDKNDGVSASLSTPTRGQRQWQAGLGNTFNGGGQIERSGQLLARISVVVDRLGEGNQLHVHGEQDIDLNGEHQRIHLEGMVRQDDIGPDNTVPSWRISDARIALIGKGILGHAQSRGLLGRILHWLHLD